MRSGRDAGMLLLSLVIALLCVSTHAQDEASFDAATGEDATVRAPSAASMTQGEVTQATGIEGWVRAAKKRTAFSIANVFESRDVWRGINWFGLDPAYLLGGDFKLDLTPYDEQRKRDIWEVKLHSMIGGAWALKAGHENNDRFKVMAVLENRIFKYLDFDIGYEHYGLPPFDDHDRDFEELLIRTGFNAIPTFRPVKLPGYEKEITSIPFGVHYGAYYGATSKSFTLTNDKYGFHGYPPNWWWHNVEFNLITPFPDIIPRRTYGILQCLKLDSTIWAIDRESVLPGLKSGLQDAEFGLAIPLILDFGKKLDLDRYVCGLFGESTLIVEPFVRYGLATQNLDMETRTWSSKDEIWGGVALVYAF
ncbi:MAG: hypothetical protein NT045_06470 [Candidatus Aureabacteria bacterium]|nr:hypothetical protein [Candidatus Auribacterota bacterium]